MPAGLAPKSMILCDSQVHSSGFTEGKTLLGEFVGSQSTNPNENKSPAPQGLPRGKAKIYDFELYLRAVAVVLLKAKAC